MVDGKKKGGKQDRGEKRTSEKRGRLREKTVGEILGVDGGGKEGGEKEWEEGFEKRLGKCFWVVGEVKEWQGGAGGRQ